MIKLLHDITCSSQDHQYEASPWDKGRNHVHEPCARDLAINANYYHATSLPPWLSAFLAALNRSLDRPRSGEMGGKVTRSVASIQLVAIEASYHWYPLVNVYIAMDDPPYMVYPISYIRVYIYIYICLNN